MRTVNLDRLAATPLSIRGIEAVYRGWNIQAAIGDRRPPPQTQRPIVPENKPARGNRLRLLATRGSTWWQHAAFKSILLGFGCLAIDNNQIARRSTKPNTRRFEESV
jgi:hypothetical protein